MNEPTKQPQRGGMMSSIGPAIITASVVLGPGSILAASKIGYVHGYTMTWILLVAVLLMIGMTALSARLAVSLDETLCAELARRCGRPVAAIVGISLFLVAACFQFGNNLGVLAAIEPFYAGDPVTPIAVIVALNVLIVVALYGFKSLYQPIEETMKVLAGLMLLAFAINLVMARPDLLQLAGGLVPRLPEGTTGNFLPSWQDGKIVDNFGPVTALFATTFSVGGAYYQSYLVRQKGWTRDHLRQGLVDSAAGIGVLGLMTLMIMITAAAVLHGRENVGEMNSAADVARQLEPAFGGPTAKIIFCVGIFAGAISSFLINAMIGGSILSDGLGLGGYIDQKWPKRLTVLVLAVGMIVAITVTLTGEKPVNLIIFAQALTVLAVPALALAMLYLATRSDLVGDRAVPTWLKVVAAIGCLAVLGLAARTAMSLYLKLSHG